MCFASAPKRWVNARIDAMALEIIEILCAGKADPGRFAPSIITPICDPPIMALAMVPPAMSPFLAVQNLVYEHGPSMSTKWPFATLVDLSYDDTTVLAVYLGIFVFAL